MDSTPAPSGQLDEAERIASLFAAERPALLRMATLMVGSAAVAEEVVQDAFVVVSRRWSSLERPGAYLWTTVVNGCAQVLRRRDAEGRALAARSRVDDVEWPSPFRAAQAQGRRQRRHCRGLVAALARVPAR